MEQFIQASKHCGLCGTNVRILAKFEKRLKRIEKTLKSTSAEELAMRYNPTIVHPELVTTDPLR